MVMNSGVILLVDDNPADVRLAMEALKESADFSMVLVAADGVEALECLRQTGKFGQVPRPDLILLDLNLPRKDGFEVLAEIKADPELRDIPVVVLTSSAAAEDRDRSLELNADSYVTKPARFDEFVTAMDTVVDYWLGAEMMDSAAALSPNESLGMAAISERV